MNDSYYIPKEISWLAFNERVLQEARNKDVPLLERVKFLGIYSNNQDEYFRVRVATLKRLAKFGKKAIDILEYDPKDTLNIINKIVLEQRQKFENTYQEILKDLEKEKIYVIDEKQVNSEQAAFISNYLAKKVRPKLMPIMLEQVTTIPDLKDDAIYFAVHLTGKTPGDEKYAIMQIPSDILPRFINLPAKDNNTCIIYLDDIIRFGLQDVFMLFDFKEIEAYTIKITKDAELDINDDISESYIQNVSESLRKRKWGTPVRFVYDETIPAGFLEMLIKKFNFKKYDTLIPGGRYHNFKDFLKFPKMNKPELYYEPISPIIHRDLKARSQILPIIRQKDILLYFPYHSFTHFIDLLREASIDPAVKSIKITIYRLAENSSVINALINAVKNGKQVTAVLELQARFDEEANIYWGKKMQDEGIRVIYGVPGIKVHAKLFLVERKEDDETIRYACIGTGNFNEDTAKVYTDHLLMTSNQDIAKEVSNVFRFFERNYKHPVNYQLITSPFTMRNRIEQLVENEIENARTGKPAYIILKLNNLVDRQMIEQLYKASNAGVRIILNIRGMFSLVPNIPGQSENIEAIGIVDRFLEHTRIMVFCNDNNEKYFITSADWMTRNIERRVEVTCPVYDKSIQQELRAIIDIQCLDNLKARVWDEELSNTLVNGEMGNTVRSQYEIYQHMLKNS